MPLKAFFFTLLLSAMINGNVQAQQSIDLHKRGTKTHYYFQAGDTISLALHSGQQLKDVWEYAGDSAIWLADRVVPLKDIRWISIAGQEKEKGLNMVANLLIIGGVGAFAIDQLNVAVFSTSPMDINPRTAAISGGVVAAGLLIKLLNMGSRTDKARIGKKYLIHLTDYSL